MCDAYGKGIVRGQVENTNLRTYSQTDNDTVALRPVGQKHSLIEIT